MTDALKMEPSAEARLTDALNRNGWLGPKPAVVPIVVEVINDAFRDGAKAERERILKMFREPSDDLILLTNAYTESGDLLLVRLADEIEADPT